MNITSTRLTTASITPFRCKQEAGGTELELPSDEVTFRFTRRDKKRLITAASVLGGAALGGVVTAQATSALTGTLAKVASGAAGALTGTAVAGVGGILIAGVLSDDSGFGGVAGAYAGALLGGVAGAVGGGYAGVVLGSGAGNVLGYAAGALLGGAVGGLAAKGLHG